MNETLKRRLTGLLLIILMLFLLSLVLPKPGEAPAESDALQRVTLDLQAPAAQPDTVLPVPSPLPPVIAAAPPIESLSVQKAVADTEPDIDEPVVPEAVSHAVAPPGAQGSGRTKVLTNQPPPKPVAAKPPQVLAKPNTKSHWYVQLGAFSNMDNAHLQLDKWKARKYQGILSPLDARKGPLYRVLIGPYTTKDQAADAQKQMIQAGELRTALIEE